MRVAKIRPCKGGQYGFGMAWHSFAPSFDRRGSCGGERRDSGRRACEGAASEDAAPAFYRYNIGAIEGTVVSDGPLSIGDPAKTFRGPTAEEVGKMMTDNFLPKTEMVLD